MSNTGVDAAPEAVLTEEAPPPTPPRVTTTQDGVRGYNLVKAIVGDVIYLDRMMMRDTQSYCGILLDDNNRRPIARLYFNSAKKTILVPTGERDDHGR